MDLDKVEDELRGLRKSDFGFTPEDGQEVYVYLKKTYRDGSVNWSTREISQTELTIGNEIDSNVGYRQIIICGDIVEKSNSYKYGNIGNISVFDDSQVVKPKEMLKQYLPNLWYICFPNYPLSTIDRDPTPDDFKITTVWGKTKAGHMGFLPAHHNKNFKLGVDWQTWHRRNAEDKIVFLTHELTHLVHSHHQKFTLEVRCKINTKTLNTSPNKLKNTPVTKEQ